MKRIFRLYWTRNWFCFPCVLLESRMSISNLHVSLTAEVASIYIVGIYKVISYKSCNELSLFSSYKLTRNSWTLICPTGHYSTDFRFCFILQRCSPAALVLSPSQHRTLLYWLWGYTVLSCMGWFTRLGADIQILTCLNLTLFSYF